MSPLQDRLAELRARVRQLLWLYGMSWLTVVLLGTLLIAGLTDWWLHLDDSGVRLILALGIVGATGYVAYGRLIAPLKVPMSDIDLALRIERRFPKFRDSLASTIQFLESNQDANLGAPEMQKRVIDQTLKQTRTIDFDDVVQSQPVQRVAWLAVLVFLTTALIAGFNRAEAATALKRLVFPFASHPWPRQTQLQFVNEQLEPLIAKPNEPLRIARGDTLELTVINLNHHKRLPNNTVLELKHPDGSITRDALQRKTLRTGDEAREAAFASLVIKTPFQFRATGGDDQTMEWFPLEVVPPPVTETLQVRLVPPKYSRRPAVKLPAGVGHVEGLVGTRVEITAKANKPLSVAVLKIRDKEQQPIKVGPDDQKLTAAFVIKEAGIYSYWLDLRDKQDFGNSDAPRYEVRAIQDGVPDIYIDKPATDIQVTPTAEIPLKFVAKDDLGLQQIRMRYQILEPGKTELSSPVEVPLITLDKRPLQQSHEHLWQLEPLKLEAGMQIQLHAEATDDFDLGSPHVGRSLTRTITIITPEEKTHELATRQIGLLDDIERAKKQETDIAAQTAELKTQLEKTGSLRPQDVDLLQRIEGQQRQVANSMQNPQDGMLTRSKDILNEFKQNRIDAPETEHRLGQINTELQRLIDDHLSEIEQNLTQARKEVGADGPADSQSSPSGKANQPNPQLGTDNKNPKNTSRPSEPTDKPATDQPQNPAPTDPAASDQSADVNPADSQPTARPVEPPRTGASPAEQALHQAQQHQQTVSDTLGDLLQELSQWQDERQAAMAVQEIRQAQEKINQDTAELGKKTVSKSLQELQPQEQADLARQSERQQHEAEQLDQLQRRIGEIVEKMEAAEPSSAGRLQDVLEQMQKNNTAGKMKEVARQVGTNNIGQATQQQQEIANELQQVEDALKNKPTSDLETLVKQMQQAEQELKDLLEKQEELLKKTEEVEQLQDPQQKQEQIEQLKKEQDALQKKAEQLARKLQRLQLKGASDAAKRAAERMDQAEENLEKDEAAAKHDEQEALDDIEQAQREVAKEREEAQERLAFEQLEKVADQIKLIAERQQAVVDETKRLNEAHAARGNWTRPQLKSLRDLAETQRGVQQDSTSLAEKLSAAEVFRLAVAGAARQMEQAAKRLDERQTDAPTQRLEESALQRFKDLMEALKEEKPEKPQEPEEPMGNAGEKQEADASPPVDRVALLAQLKMLRALQVELNAQLQELATKRDTGNPLNTGELEELKAIGEEQGKLADLAAKFMESFNPAAQPAPTTLPAEDKEEK